MYTISSWLTHFGFYPCKMQKPRRGEDESKGGKHRPSTQVTHVYLLLLDIWKCQQFSNIQTLERFDISDLLNWKKIIYIFKLS